MKPERGEQPAHAGRSRILFAARLTVTLILVVLLVHRIDWDVLRDAGRDLSWRFVSLALASYVVNAVLDVTRLKTALVAYRLRAGKLWSLYLAGVFFGNLLPGQLGADLYRAAVLRPRGPGSIHAMSLVLLVRVYGVAALAVGAAAALLAEPTALTISMSPQGGWWLRSLLVAAIAVTVMLAFLLSLPSARTGVLAPLLERVRTVLGSIRSALATVKLRGAVVLFALSMIIVAMRVVILMLLLTAVGARVSGGQALLVVCCTSLITLLPISIAGIGVREGTMVALLHRFSVAFEDAFLIAIVWRVFILLLSLAGAATLAAGSRRKAAASMPATGEFTGKE
ncbi:MAG: flippase-like domain-containing protein [bacterium]|nr:flippase-like domain-containing protein [bacterium]